MNIYALQEKPDHLRERKTSRSWPSARRLARRRFELRSERTETFVNMNRDMAFWFDVRHPKERYESASLQVETHNSNGEHLETRFSLYIAVTAQNDVQTY